MQLHKAMAAVIGLATLTLLVPTAAHAASAPAKRHCVQHVTQGNKVTCYTTFTEAIADATNGKVAGIAADNPCNTLNSAAFAEKLNTAATKPDGPVTIGAGGTAVGIEFEHIGCAGWTWTIEVDRACTTTLSDVDVWVDSTWGYWWNDVISSFRTFSNCWVNHYEHSYYTGAQTGYLPTQYYIGDTMNDKTSSLRWS